MTAYRAKRSFDACHVELDVTKNLHRSPYRGNAQGNHERSLSGCAHVTKGRVIVVQHDRFVASDIRIEQCGPRRRGRAALASLRQIWTRG